MIIFMGVMMLVRVCMRHGSMAVFVRVRVLMFMFAGHDMHIALRARNRPPFLARHVKMIFTQPQLLQFVLERAGIETKIQHRSDKHVAANAAENIQIKCFHLASLASAFIWLAAYPAPKPLSMFTTVTPLPQLFSMASNAARPPKFAP